MEIIVVCHNIRSIHNVGSIFRTADAAGVARIYLCGITPTPLDRFGKVRPDLAKVSLGAERYIAWESASDTTTLIKKLKNEGWRILALEQSKKSVPYNKIPKAYLASHNLCILLGTEVDGLPPSLLKLADKVIEIPMFGKKESLNVAVAFGVAIFGLRSSC